MSNKYLSLPLSITLSLGLLASVSLFPSNSNTVHADSELKIGGNGYQCNEAEPNRWKTENTSSADLGSGYTIESVTVKASTGCINVYPTNTEPTCYNAVVNGGSVTVTKIGDGRSCKDISHLEGTYVAVTSTNTPTQTPTNTPTPTKTSTPTPTDTPTVTSTPTPTGFNTNTGCVSNCTTPTPTPTIGVTETPTPTTTQGVSATATPTPTSSNNTGAVLGASSTTPQVQAATAVLGASTMASTGTFTTSLMNSLLSLGMVSLSIGSLLYAKTKKA